MFCVGLETSSFILEEQQYHNLLFTQRRGSSPSILCPVSMSLSISSQQVNLPWILCLHCLWLVDEFYGFEVFWWNLIQCWNMHSIFLAASQWKSSVHWGCKALQILMQFLIMLLNELFYK